VSVKADYLNGVKKKLFLRRKVSNHRSLKGKAVAEDAQVGVSVMMTHYVEEMDEQMRQRSNRTYQRIVASLSPEVRRRYGYAASPTAELEGLIQAAYSARDWQKVAELAAKLEQRRGDEGSDL
jgi:hypothetical protein